MGQISRIAGLSFAPVAQLDRVAVSEAVGRWFESSQVRHFILPQSQTG